MIRWTLVLMLMAALGLVTAGCGPDRATEPAPTQAEPATEPGSPPDPNGGEPGS